MSLLSLTALAAILVPPAVAHPSPTPPLDNVFAPQAPLAIDNQIRVPVLLGVMSRCPDALLCESVFDGVLKHTWDIVDISLSFVGKLDESDPEFGVSCMHGVSECRGNVHELCAMNRAQSQQDWWNFVQCLNFEGKAEIGDPVLAQRCAGLAYIPWDDQTDVGRGIRSCIESQEGVELLKASVKQTESLGIKRSCTIMISGKTRCVHDGTWKDCETGHSVEEIIGYLQDEYQKLNAKETSLEDQ